MSAEEQFFLSLRAVSIHMIKHVRPIYKALLPVLESHEEGRWKALPQDTRIAQLESIAHQLAQDSEITKYFADYPHKWSRERFAKLQTDLDAYLSELKNG